MKNIYRDTLMASALRNLAGIGIAAHALVTAFTGSATSQELIHEQSDVLAYGGSIHLAYVETGNPTIDRRVERGLEALHETLDARTSTKPATDVIARNIEDDTLIPFPCLYWPVIKESSAITEEAQRKVQDYIDSGAVIIFDVLEPTGDVKELVQQQLGSVNLGALSELPANHTLTRTHYISDELAGTYNQEPVWIQTPNPSRSEDVTSVVLARRNWIDAWAGVTIAKGEEAYDAALRTGVNLILGCLVGGYKSDQFQMQQTLDSVLDR